MSKRRNLGGRYVETREKSTKKGNRGTIMKNWSPKQKTTKSTKAKEIKEIVFWLIIAALLIIAIYVITNYL